MRSLREIAEFLWKVIDIKVINNFLINGLGHLLMGFGGLTSFQMTGNLQRHAMLAMIGITALLVVLVL